jgi:hypothetical protein
MQINTIKRPWEKNKSYGSRLKKNPFYQSREWKDTRKAHDLGTTLVNGVLLENIYCVQCFIEKGIKVLGRNKDHIKAIEDGGSKTDTRNIQGLCDSHHNSKSAIEGNNRRREKTLQKQLNEKDKAVP